MAFTLLNSLTHSHKLLIEEISLGFDLLKLLKHRLRDALIVILVRSWCRFSIFMDVDRLSLTFVCSTHRVVKNNLVIQDFSEVIPALSLHKVFTWSCIAFTASQDNLTVCLALRLHTFLANVIHLRD